METHVEAARARIMAAAGPQTAMEAMHEDDQSRERSKLGEAEQEDEGFEIVGVSEAHEVEQRKTEVADRAGPKTGEAETCSHWAKGWCMRANACRFAHPQHPVPRGVPQNLLLILRAIARVGALSLHLSRHHETQMREVVEKAQGGGLTAVGYAVVHGSRLVWAVALPCGRAFLLTPFSVVLCRDVVTLQEASLGWMCTWHTHPAGMDPHGWQARAVLTRAGGQNQKWPTYGQNGYVTPAVSGIPTAGERGHKIRSGRLVGIMATSPLPSRGSPPHQSGGTKSEVAHLWERWPPHPCRLGDPPRIRAGGQNQKWPTCG